MGGHSPSSADHAVDPAEARRPCGEGELVEQQLEIRGDLVARAPAERARERHPAGDLGQPVAERRDETDRLQLAGREGQGRELDRGPPAAGTEVVAAIERQREGAVGPAQPRREGQRLRSGSQRALQRQRREPGRRAVMADRRDAERDRLARREAIGRERDLARDAGERQLLRGQAQPAAGERDPPAPQAVLVAGERQRQRAGLRAPADRSRPRDEVEGPAARAQLLLPMLQGRGQQRGVLRRQGEGERPGLALGLPGEAPDRVSPRPRGRSP